MYILLYDILFDKIFIIEMYKNINMKLIIKNIINYKANKKKHFKKKKKHIKQIKNLSKQKCNLKNIKI